MLDERTLVLESVTLAQVVELVVEVLVDLAGGAVLDEQAAQDTQTAHPHHLTVISSVHVQYRPVSHATCSRPATPFRSLIRRSTHLGILASLVPFLLPKPLCLPILLAAVSSRARERECMVTGLRMMRPSAMSLRTVWRELALEISPTSFGSSQILRLPQSATEAARRFCVRRFTLMEWHGQFGCLHGMAGAGLSR